MVPFSGTVEFSISLLLLNVLCDRILYVSGILATLVASQAMITATFSLCQQLVNMRSLPALSMVYTSETVQGQVFIPTINWALMVITIIIVVAFKSSTALTNAYGRVAYFRCLISSLITLFTDSRCRLPSL
jgi:K+ transporter